MHFRYIITPATPAMVDYKPKFLYIALSKLKEVNCQDRKNIFQRQQGNNPQLIKHSPCKWEIFSICGRLVCLLCPPSREESHHYCETFSYWHSQRLYLGLLEQLSSSVFLPRPVGSTNWLHNCSTEPCFNFFAQELQLIPKHQKQQLLTCFNSPVNCGQFSCVSSLPGRFPFSNSPRKAGTSKAS